jgi:hypothetical protein
MRALIQSWLKREPATISCQFSFYAERREV